MKGSPVLEKFGVAKVTIQASLTLSHDVFEDGNYILDKISRNGVKLIDKKWFGFCLLKRVKTSNGFRSVASTTSYCQMWCMEIMQ